MRTSEPPPTGIPASELAQRRGRLLEHARSRGLSGYVLFDQKYIEYFTSFGFLSTERPVVFAASASGETVVFVPEFEVERVRDETAFERIESYPEYPGIEHPMRILARVLAAIGIRDSVGADQDGYPGILGYAGPAAERGRRRNGRSARRAHREHDGEEERERGRADPRERPLVRAARIGCSRRTRGPAPPRREASLRAGQEATLQMLKTLGDAYGGQQASSDGVSAGYRGPDRAAQLLGARGRAQHRVPAGRRARDRDERPDLGL